MEHSLSLCLTGYAGFGQLASRSFFEVIGRLLCLALEIALSGYDVFLVGAIRCLVIIILITGSDSDLLGAPVLPLLLPLVLLLAPLLAALGSAPCLPLGIVIPSLWM
jgi:hypothetical protein